MRALLQKVFKPKPTGITCEYCGWNGSATELQKAKYLNTDGTPYEIRVCPQCQRNGGLFDHDSHKI
jgi:hypothetical protein